MSTLSIEQLNVVTARRITLRGFVQGLGVRPAVARLAQSLQLTGSVCNNDDGVFIYVEGLPENVDRFRHQLSSSLPKGSVVDEMCAEEATPVGSTAFEITQSHCPTTAPAAAVPLDTSICPACQVEMTDPTDRRLEYPFTNCTDCGPRYSLVDSMPYDRHSTAMSDFHLCDDCLSEYRSDEDRRFHAQTNACDVCGPKITFCDGVDGVQSAGPAAIAKAAEAIRHGRIVAIKGVGGYQLACDATSTAAIQRLRTRKRRARKPLAVMVSSVDQAMQLASISAEECQTLQCPANPIVLLDAAQVDEDGPGIKPLSHLINPGLNQIGIMLPTTGLHLQLLLQAGGPCVMTSGNVDGEPLSYCDDHATQHLHDVVDAYLTHNRRIARPIDDSVVRRVGYRTVAMRTGRGLAPLPINVDSTEHILAVAGHQKAAIALSNGRQSVLGPHIGNLDSLATRTRFLDQIEDLKQLYRTQPTVIAHDMHPEFFTTQWAMQQQVPTVPVQHHHAHVVAQMIEHKWLDGEVLGVAFDGSGFGTDGTIWGGEFLLCTTAAFKRVARFRPFPLVGGEQAIREPWRVAAALIHSACGRAEFETERDWLTRSREPGSVHCVAAVSNLLQKSLKAGVTADSGSLYHWTSSVGRLFDGVASLLLQIAESSYEGEPAMRLEAICDRSNPGEYDLTINSGPLIEIDWRPMIRQLLNDKHQGIATATIATRFTRTIARAIHLVSTRFTDHSVVLTGGCFQNAVLTEEAADLMKSHPQPLGLPGQIPPNDGGLAAGQLAVAAARLAMEPISNSGNLPHKEVR